MITTTTTTVTEDRGDDPPHGTHVSWPPIFTGAIVGLSVLLLLGSFWLALSTEWGFMSRNFQWFQMGSAFFAWFLAGLVTSWLARSKGPLVGMLHGLVVWGLIVVARTVITIPSATDAINVALAGSTGSPQWAGFGAITGGLVAALIGGTMGGGLPALHHQTGRFVRVDQVESSEAAPVGTMSAIPEAVDPQIGTVPPATGDPVAEGAPADDQTRHAA